VAPSVQRRKVWLMPTTRVPCSNAAKTRNLLKLAGVPQTRQRISAVNGPEFTRLCRHVEEILLFNKFFPVVDTCLSCEDMARQNCAMVRKWRFFMVALWNRETIYIFMLWFVLLSSFFFFSSPNLSRRRLDVCHTSTHGVALVRI